MPNIPELIRQMIEADGSQAAVAERLGASQPDISRWARGRGQMAPNYERIMDEARKMGLIASDVRSEDVAHEQERERRTLRIKGYVGAGGTAHFYSVSDDNDLDEVAASDDDPENAAALEIRGTSLGRMFDRWYAIYVNVRSPVTEDLIGKGKLCVVGLEDDRVLIKEIRRNGNNFDLLPNDSSEETIRNVRIKWAARVTKLRPKDI